MAYAIMRMKKHKTPGTLGAAQAHTYRTRDTPNADPKRAALNVVGLGTRGDLVGDVRRRVAAVTDRPRKNAVLALEFLLTASPEWWEGKTDKEVKAWARASTVWLREEFGKDNVVHVVLHRDETSPHLVAMVVPEKEGRLNARGLVGSPELLSNLQTRYAATMEPLGLERGIKGSQARHQTVRAYYAKLNDAAATAGKELARLGELTPPPKLSLFQGREARQKAVDGWKRKEEGKRRKLVKEASRAVLAASEAQDQVINLRTTSEHLAGELALTQQRLTAAYEALSLSKEDVAVLRRSDVQLVATRLGHLGPIAPKENAIDLLKRTQGFDYGQAVAWLHAEFGSVLAGAVVKKSLEANPPERPFTKAENVIKAAIVRQADALGAQRFRVSVVPEGEGAKPFLPGKAQGGGEERFYTREELVGLIPWLRYENNQGKHIFVTPMDDTAHYVLLDDCRLTAAELTARGFTPCLVQRSSWDRTQVVLKVPKELDREAVNNVFMELNRTHGDATINGLRHPFRLAGFRNMKAKHEREGQFPFVSLVAATNQFCRKTTALVRDVIRRVEEAVRLEAPRPR